MTSIKEEEKRRKVFLAQLTLSVYSARIRVGWAKGKLRDAEGVLRKARRELKEWSRIYKPRRKKARK